ncbi:universal stress protein [Nocardia huaxiensis]|uniref:Universal stress protein n=1 Tax=Nocardia huaxiensis TaxID=2755382 RepID=A0A7D6Z785_9NOCA|nr:universal stress protein [Nocardia huaxiensis]QLY28548.1 universal stress protein [Nocardia huaxiensis]UFS97985.1 universal stress protein [Nocardia huaxiensis]
MTAHAYGDPHLLASAAVVVGVDGSPGSETALRWAAAYAAGRGRGLHIVHGMDLVGINRVLGVYEVVVPRLVESARAHGKAVVLHAERLVRELEPGLRVTVHLSADDATRLLIERSATAYAVVLGATGENGTVSHLGSTLLAVTAHARCPVLVVRPDPDADNTVRETGPVVVGVDGSPVSEAAIGAAFVEAAERRTTLVAVHVWSDWVFGKFAGAKPLPALGDLDNVEEAILAERLAGWREKYPEVEVTRRIYFSDPATHLRTWSALAQLVVVGNRGRGGLMGMLLGSTTHSLVQHAHCPVMVVHPDR